MSTSSFRSRVSQLQGESLELRSALNLLADSGDPSRGRTLYVDAVDGADGNDGLSWERPKLTMASAFTSVKSGETIRFRGKITEQINTPAQVFDVTVIGDANRHRHADVTPVDPYGKTHGASWATVGTPVATTPLVTVRNQGWRFINILFDAPADDACVELYSDAGASNDERDGSHASFISCRFVDGQEGILSTGGQANVLIDGCIFKGLTTAVKCASTGVRINQYWMIRNNHFINNTNHISSSFSYSNIRDNTFGVKTTTGINTKANSNQGSDNVVGPGNVLYGTYSIAQGYTPATADVWAGNFNIAGITAANPA